MIHKYYIPFLRSSANARFLIQNQLQINLSNIIPIYESWKMEDLKQFGFTLPTINHESLSDKAIALIISKMSPAPATSFGFWFNAFILSVSQVDLVLSAL